MMSLSRANQVVEGFLCGPDVTFDSVSIDSRNLDRGALFVAVRGEHFDGHDFVEKAALFGAVAAIVDREVEANIPTIIVEDTKRALRKLAAYWRNQFPIPVIAVTGSCGKTTVRAMLERIFSQQGKTLASEKSYNNDIGVPLTLLKLDPQDEYAVIEMGMNHPGEIELLTHLARPDVAIITCIAPVHLEALKTEKNIAKAKAEIYDGLSSTGVAIINNDDAFASFFKKQAKDQKQITFAIERDADVRAENIQLNVHCQPVFKLVTSKGAITIELPLIGKHNIVNALAAAAAAISQNLSLKQIKAGLESVGAVTRRLCEIKGKQGSTIIDDSYNANPASVSAAIDILAARQGDSVLVLGDMLELGERAKDFHAQVGERAKTSGVQHLYCFGKLTEYTAQAFGQNAQHFEDQAALLEALSSSLTSRSVVLVKGSNGMNMNHIVKALTEN